MKCSPKCEWQIQAPWGELSHRQLSPHLQQSSPLSSPPPLALSHGSGQLAFNVTSWGNPRAPPVFLAHGRQDCATTFQPLLELMNPEDFFYVSIDMPGSGNSAPFPIEPQGRSTDYCLKIEVPEEPFNLEDQEVTLILARDRLNEDNDQPRLDGPTSNNYMPRPKIMPSFYSVSHHKDFVIIQMEEDEEDNKRNSELINNINLKDFNANLPLKIQTNFVRDQYTPSSIYDDSDTDWTDIDSDENDPEELTDGQNKQINVCYRDISSEIRRTSILDECARSRYRPLAAIPQNGDDENLVNAMSNLDIHGQKHIICRSLQKRKHGMKLMKTPDDSIVCNDHGGRECPFARSAFQEPSERVFFIRGLKKAILPSYLRRKLARGGSGRYWFTWGIIDEEPIQDPDQAVSESSSLSPLSLFEDIDDNDSNSSTECGLSECPHLPAGLLDWLHIFYKDGGMPNYANRPVADPWADDVSQSPTISHNEYPVDMPIYETFPQTYSHVREMHNYAKRPVADPWANDDQQSPIIRQNRETLNMPTIYETLPERDTYAPKVRLYNPGYFARTSSNISPGASSVIDIARPGLYTPIGTAPGYNYEYMHPDRYSPEPADPPQHRPFCLSPWTYFDELTPSPSNSHFVPCPIQANGLPCCFNNVLQTAQESIPSNSFSRQERNNEEMYEIAEDFYNTVFAVSPSANDGGGARPDREPGNGVKILRFQFVAAMAAAIEHLGWEKFMFIGHSMGSEIGLFYNSVNPGKITKMILCDPEPTLRRLQVRDLPRYQTMFYDDYYNNYWKDNFYYRTYTVKEAKQALMRARNLTEDKASIILSNSLKHVHGDQYRFTWDRRLKLPAPQNYPNSYYFSIFSNMPPTLVISASDSLREQSQSGSLELLKMLSTLENYNHVMVEGGHDVHLTNPERLAPHVIEFLKKETKVNSKL
ncbi:unnamed protein product [Arctia plantaginis]|uniref:AB hydrolase-1 domain-containing protein n=1 Tax=Arctia plantaginis TaxID=874455 RepID=A0A8S0YT39_ARCPL|nr:unnamed protein product [Arctia plantaginis]